MCYHLFHKEVLSKNKKIKKWYYWYYQDGKQVQKACRNCNTKAEAELFIENLPKLERKSETKKIKDIAEFMYIPGSMHVKRREQLGKSTKTDTLVEWRRFLDVIVKNFGECNISELSVKDFMSFLLAQDRSTSWKNHLINVMSEVYSEAVWEGYILSAPTLQTFRQKYHKADPLTPDEIKLFAQRKNFANETEYMLFLLTLSAGMRISEARGFRACQLSETNNIVYIDGFLDELTQERKSYCKSGNEENPMWRVAIIPERTAEELRNYIKASNKSPDELLFTHDSSPYRIEYCRTLFLRALAKAGIKKENRKLTCHSLRYTYVTRMRQLYEADTVRKMAGHTNQKMNDYYNRPTMLEDEKSLAPLVNKAAGFFDD